MRIKSYQYLELFHVKIFEAVLLRLCPDCGRFRHNKAAGLVFGCVREILIDDCVMVFMTLSGESPVRIVLVSSLCSVLIIFVLESQMRSEKI